MSAVRNVADLGQPTAGPVQASTSSTVMSSVCIGSIAFSIENVPMRLAMKFGVSFALHDALAEPQVADFFQRRKHFGAGLGPGDQFHELHVARRIEEMRAGPVLLEILASGLRAIRRIGSPEVLEVTIVPGLRTASTRSNNWRLISRFSATASMIQSTWPHHARLSSKLPGVMSRAVSGVKNAAGRDFFAASSPASTMRLRTLGS